MVLDRRIRKWKEITRQRREKFEQYETFSATVADLRMTLVGKIKEKERFFCENEDRVIQLEKYAKLLVNQFVAHQKLSMAT